MQNVQLLTAYKILNLHISDVRYIQLFFASKKIASVSHFTLALRAAHSGHLKECIQILRRICRNLCKVCAGYAGVNANLAQDMSEFMQVLRRIYRNVKADNPSRI